MKLCFFFILNVALENSSVTSMLQQLLKKSVLSDYPIFDKKDIWRRNLPNIAIYGNLTLSLRRTLSVPTPSYVQVLTDRILSVTSFSLLRKGCIMQFDLQNTSTSNTIRGDYLWPNELAMFKDNLDRPVMLIPDGFLLPGQSDGGLYVVRDPHLEHSLPVRITAYKSGWFYHRATHVRLPGGKQGILTARAKKSFFGPGEGELVWLTIPQAFADGASNIGEQQPWAEVVLARGPDVMFDVFDLDAEDESVEVVAAHFFNKRLSVYSLSACPDKPYVKVVERTSLDTVGRPYGLCLARMTPPPVDGTEGPLRRLIGGHLPHPPTQSDSGTEKLSSRPSHIIVSTHECSYDLLSALKMILLTVSGRYPRVKTGGTGLRTGEKVSIETGSLAASTDSGGGLYAYEIPYPTVPSTLPLPFPAVMKAEALHHSLADSPTSWVRQTLFRGFKVRAWGGIFSPGAPGFPYVFQMPTKSKRTASPRPFRPPLILLAGDCTGSAYVFAPVIENFPNKNSEWTEGARDSATGSSGGALPGYGLAFEVECGATVGSAAVSAPLDKSGDMEIFIPSYELNKVHVFRLSESDDAS